VNLVWDILISNIRRKPVVAGLPLSDHRVLTQFTLDVTIIWFAEDENLLRT